MTKQLIALTIISVCTMATVPVLVKSVAANEMTIAIARLLIAVLVFSPLVAFRSRLGLLKRQDWLQLAIIGLVFAAHWLGYFLIGSLCSVPTHLRSKCPRSFYQYIKYRSGT